VLFQEPRLESGSPDLVYVSWRSEVVDKWSRHRDFLTLRHLKLLQYLHSRRSIVRTGSLHFGAHRQLLRDLVVAGLVLEGGDDLTLTPLSRAFAATRIVAFEAKISEWSRVLRQAYANTWFASESYILLPRAPKHTRHIERARELGVGVYVLNSELRRLASPRRYPLPASYASWQVNEWLVRLSLARQSCIE
jgi:hypothetical protein